MSRRNVNEHLHHRDSAKLAACGIDDLLSFTEGGKHDYDWLLTPPGTPDFPSSESEFKPNLAPTRSRLGRPTSNTNASRLSASNNHSRPARSSSVTRSSSISSNSQNNTNSSNKSSSSILNNRPSSPTTTRSPSSIRSSTPSRPSTPSRIPSIADKTRPSTPTHNKPATANLQSPSPGRSLSRPSTPISRHSMTSFPSPTTTTPLSSRGRNSRPSSPSPRLRPPPQPIVPHDFPLETPPNLRTTLPNRPLYAGRSRPGAPITTNLKPNSETQASVTAMSRTLSSSPVVNRGRLLEHTGNGNGRVSYSPEVRKSVKASTAAAENNGFGRTISKKSLDMAIRHMDIRNRSGTVRSLSSATLFPQSIRTPTPKSKIQQPTRGLSAPASVDNDIYRSLQSRNNRMNGRGREINERERQYFAKLSEVEYHSSRYDALLLKEDLGNTNWLHSFDEKYDQGPIFDNGFESLPEPFALL